MLEGKKNKDQKYSVQFARTVAKTGKWRGKKSSEYKKYVKPRKAMIFNVGNPISDKEQKKIYKKWLVDKKKKK